MNLCCVFFNWLNVLKRLLSDITKLLFNDEIKTKQKKANQTNSSKFKESVYRQLEIILKTWIQILFSSHSDFI